MACTFKRFYPRDETYQVLANAAAHTIEKTNRFKGVLNQLVEHLDNPSDLAVPYVAGLTKRGLELTWEHMNGCLRAFIFGSLDCIQVLLESEMKRARLVTSVPREDLINRWMEKFEPIEVLRNEAEATPDMILCRTMVVCDAMKAIYHRTELRVYPSNHPCKTFSQVIQQLESVRKALVWLEHKYVPANFENAAPLEWFDDFQATLPTPKKCAPVSVKRARKTPQKKSSGAEESEEESQHSDSTFSA